MKLLILMSSMLLFTSASVPDSIEKNPEDHSETSYLNMDECQLFHSIMGTTEDNVLAIEAISVLELEEELNIGFDTKAFLPKDFDAYEQSETVASSVCSKKNVVL